MKLSNVLLALGIFTAGLSAHAEKKASLHDQFTGQQYGMAGCGLGSVVFGDKPGMIQVVAATINGTGMQTFAISSGTSNCGESGKSAQATQFIEVNKVAIEKDVVRGQGETISALSELLECKNGTFSQDLKSNYNQTFPQGGASSAQIEAIALKSCQI